MYGCYIGSYKSFKFIHMGNSTRMLIFLSLLNIWFTSKLGPFSFFYPLKYNIVHITGLFKHLLFLPSPHPHKLVLVTLSCLIICYLPCSASYSRHSTVSVFHEPPPSTHSCGRLTFSFQFFVNLLAIPLLTCAHCKAQAHL